MKDAPCGFVTCAAYTARLFYSLLRSSVMTADSPASAPSSAVSATDSPWQVFLIFLRLGLTSFGGPTAHLGYFRDEFVARRKWLSEAAYADLVALCQFLPGPAGSQVGLALGMLRAGQRGEKQHHAYQKRQ